MRENFIARFHGLKGFPAASKAVGMEQTLLRYVVLYNHRLPQSALQSRTPMQTMKDRH